MEKEELNDLIPDQQTGAESNTENVTELSSEEEASRFFEDVKQRLLRVNDWHEISGALTADFQLTDAQGTDVFRPAQQGDHFRIDIPGPGTVTGEGYDWVQIEKLEEGNEPGSQMVAIRVRPATNPNNERNDVAHFFSEEATSSFIVKREGTKITAGVYGRNEKPNTHTETVVDKARNTAVATGATGGFAKLQWKSLVTALLKREA